MPDEPKLDLAAMYDDADDRYMDRLNNGLRKANTNTDSNPVKEGSEPSAGREAGTDG